MASFYGYVVMIVGLSLLLAMAGVNTAGGKVVGLFVDVTPQNSTSNFGVDATNFDKENNWYLIALFGIIGILAAIGVTKTIISGSSDMAATLKVGSLTTLLALLIIDFVSIIKYVNTIGYLDGVLKAVAIVIYVPLAIGSVISGLDWIGGGR